MSGKRDDTKGKDGRKDKQMFARIEKGKKKTKKR